MRSLARIYGWPDFQTVTRTPVSLDPAVLERYVGTYQMAPGFDFVFAVENRHLVGHATGQSKLLLYPESEHLFFLKEVDAQIEFVADALGKVNEMVLHQGGREHRGEKMK